MDALAQYGIAGGIIGLGIMIVVCLGEIISVLKEIRDKK